MAKLQQHAASSPSQRRGSETSGRARMLGRLGAVLGIAVSLGGCAYYPYGYGYAGPAPGYYAPAYRPYAYARPYYGGGGYYRHYGYGYR